MITRRELTQLMLLSPLAAQAQQRPKAPIIVALDGQPVTSSGGGSLGTPADLNALPTSAGPNESAYSSLNVRGMPAGTAFPDPVTGVRTVKLTASGTPGSGHYFNMYSTLGLQISQAWGPNRDQYTIVFQSGGSLYLCDYQLGGSPTNYRSAAGGEGRFSFSRLPGRERMAYVYSGGQLSLYDTGSNSSANTGALPLNWSGASTWLQLNADETWATMTGNGGVTALRLTDGLVRTSSVSGIDEIYSGYNDVALINAGSNSRVWDLNSDTLSPISMPYSGFSRIFHLPSMRGYWVAVDSNFGNGVMPYTRIAEDGSTSPTFSQEGYWGQLHMCGHWWDQPEGSSQYFLRSNWDNGSNWSPSEKYSIHFVRANDGSKRVLGHSYSDTVGSSTDSYRSQPHATQSTDGKIVIYASNMLNGPRIDVFLMEVPI